MATGLLTAALAETAIVSYREISQHKAMPLPSTYVAVAVVYGGLGLFPDSANRFTAFVGWGLVLATVLNLWSPQKPLTLAKPGGKVTTTAGPLTAQGAAA